MGLISQLAAQLARCRCPRRGMLLEILCANSN